MRRLSALLLMMLAGHPAAADDDVDPNALLPSDVQERATGKTVTLTARFAFEADGGMIEQGARSVALPRNSVVTAATATVGGVSHRLALTPATEASRAFEQLTSDPPAAGKRWAINIAASEPATVTIDVAAGANARVSLELVVETHSCFHGDHRYVALPPAWFSHLRTPRTAIRDGSIGETCGELDNGEEWIAFGAGELARKASGESRIGTLAGLLPLGEEQLGRIEIDLASKLTDVPPDLHTAIVVDTSRSLTADQIELQRAIVASYIQHLPPQSRVQIIAYARNATALLPTWLPAASAAPRIDREMRALAPRNGSNVDLGIAEANAWLARANGTRRMIVIGDDEFPFRIDETFVPTLAPSVPAGTLVHAVDLSANTTGLMRIEGLALAPLAQATEGIAVGAGLDERKSIDATMLVRPTSIDDVTISGPGWQASDPLQSLSTCQHETPLAEGTACTWWGVATGAVGPITLDAMIWGHRIHRMMRADPLDALHLARELSIASIFDDHLKQLVDQAAHAVNSAWSLFGTWGGTGGYEEGGGMGGFGIGGGCCGDIGIGDIGHGTTGRRLDFSSQLAPALTACHVTGAAVDVRLETTREEIVDVEVTVSPANDAQRDCIVERVWDTSLSIADAPFHTISTTHIKP